VPYKNGIEKLDRDIDQSKVVVVFLMLFIPLSYGAWFWYLNNYSVSRSSGDWGTFGDFVGGLLNPAVAYFAFYWLIKSVRIQKEELLETRLALEDTAKSQQQQVQISAMNTLTNSIMAEVEIHRNQLQFITDQFMKTFDDPITGVRVMDVTGQVLDRQQTEELIAEINARITKRLKERLEYEKIIGGLIHRQDTV